VRDGLSFMAETTSPPLGPGQGLPGRLAPTRRPGGRCGLEVVGEHGLQTAALEESAHLAARLATLHDLV